MEHKMKRLASFLITGKYSYNVRFSVCMEFGFKILSVSPDENLKRSPINYFNV